MGAAAAAAVHCRYFERCGCSKEGRRLLPLAAERTSRVLLLPEALRVELAKEAATYELEQSSMLARELGSPSLKVEWSLTGLYRGGASVSEM